MDRIDAEIERGEALERAGKPDDAMAYFEGLAARHPEHPGVVFALAGAYDFAGREQDAVAPYRRARELGLPETLLPRWYVQFGSTLRNVGEFAEAVAVLGEGRARYPDDTAIACFLALAHHSAGDSARGLRTALEAVVAAAAAGRIDIRHYGRALRWYALDLTGDAPPD